MRRIVCVAVALGLLALQPSGSATTLVDPPGPCDRTEETVPRSPLNVELVTVTEGTFAVTWMTCAEGKPLPSDTTVAWGPSPNPGTWQKVTVEEDTPFHHAEIGGLEGGTTYFYQVFSNGLPGLYDRYHPGVFTTLSLPEGQHLFSFAILADTHIGEDVSGLATREPFEFPPAYRSEEPYGAQMTAAAVAESRDHGIALAILPADNTHHGERTDMETLRGLLEELDAPYLLARGAHDRPNQYDDAQTECGPDGDCFRDVFFPERAAGAGPQDIFYAHDVEGFRFIALDSANLQTGMGELDSEQLAWFADELEDAAEEGHPAFVFFHHPVSEWSTTLAVPPLVFGVRQDQANAFLQIAGEHDVRAVFNAHTHRNWLSYSPHAGRMPIVETGPVKEYPGGYAIVRVYEGGFVLNFHRLSCEFCREWIHTTRWQYFGQYPHYTPGSLRDRNFVHHWDGTVPGVPSLPFNPWPPGAPKEG